MATDVATSLPTPGFKFDNYLRNAYLQSQGFQTLKTRKTGTTIVGIVYKDGVILGADTRATQGSVVADKFCNKIHYIAKNMYCCGAGTAADTEATTRMISSQLELHRMATDRSVPVAAAAELISQYLFRYQGHVSAALVLGGVDSTGAHVYTIHPHGSCATNKFATMGSGSLAAISVFEKGWKPDMELEQGKKLVRDGIAAGVFNDLGSGNNIDLCIITREGVKSLRFYEKAVEKGPILGSYNYKPGTTAVLTTQVIPLDVVEATVKKTTDEDSMETE